MTFLCRSFNFYMLQAENDSRWWRTDFDTIRTEKRSSRTFLEKLPLLRNSIGTIKRLVILHLHFSFTFEETKLSKNNFGLGREKDPGGLLIGFNNFFYNHNYHKVLLIFIFFWCNNFVVSLRCLDSTLLDLFSSESN